MPVAEELPTFHVQKNQFCRASVANVRQCRCLGRNCRRTHGCESELHDFLFRGRVPLGNVVPEGAVRSFVGSTSHTLQEQSTVVDAVAEFSGNLQKLMRD